LQPSSFRASFFTVIVLLFPEIRFEIHTSSVERNQEIVCGAAKPEGLVTSYESLGSN
jgi:hypothetical protein